LDDALLAHIVQVNFADLTAARSARASFRFGHVGLPPEFDTKCCKWLI